MAAGESRPLTWDEITSLFHFLSHIEWMDPWLIALIIFHISITTTSLLTRNHGNFQVLLFLALLLMVYFSESINEIAAKNWNLFSRQQYFDSNGVFISLMFSAPILLNCMILVASWLYQSSQLMTELKRAKLQRRLKLQKTSRKENASVDAIGIERPRFKHD